MNAWKKKRLHNAGMPKGFWGRATLLRMNESHRLLTDVGLTLVKFPENAVCLDIGCGGGRTLSELSKRTKGKVYGVDVSDAAIKVSSRYNLLNVRKGKIVVEKASVSELPFADAFFDVVTSVESFYFWEDKEDCVKEVFRVMKPGGTFVVMLDAFDDGKTDYSELVQEIGLELNTPSFFREVFTEAGFADVDIVIECKRIYVRGKK